MTDATGRELPARMETLTLAGARKIRIVFDGDGAVYPVTVDPLATASAWDAESNQDGAWFGSSVSAAGDVNGDGYADVIVAALFYDNGLAHAGRVYAYHGSASGLNDDAAWIAEGDQEEAHFGAAIGTAGDVNGDGYSDVIVGTASYENEEMAPGRVWVYHGSAAGLGAVPAWTVGSDTPGLTWFGIAVGTAGDVNSDGYSDVVVGASSYTNTEGFEGRAYVYHGSAAGLHTVEAWYVDGEQLNLRLGEAVGTAGDVNDDGYSDVIVGGSGAGEPFAKGQVRVYHGSEQGLSAAADWTRESLYTEVPFGEAAGTAGDVNGDGYSDVIFANGDGGRVDVHHGSAAGLSAVPDWTVQDDQPASRFGSTLSTAGDVNGDGFSDVIIGAFRYDTNENDEGRAVVYHGSPSGLTTVEAWVVEGDEQDGNLARSVCTAGDVNDDGYSDVIIGAWRQDNGEVDEGRAFVYHGSAVGLGFSAGDVSGLFVAKAPGGRIKPTWGSSCTIGDSDYAVYEGILGDFMSHTARFCGTGGLLSKTFVPLSGATYYLVVPMNGTREGSYGLSSAGERSAAVDACLPQQLGACPAR